MPRKTLTPAQPPVPRHLVLRARHVSGLPHDDDAPNPRVTYYSSIQWGWYATHEQHEAWRAAAAEFLRGLFPGAEVRVLELNERSSVGFRGNFPLNEQEVLDLLQTEWERFAGTL